MQGLVEFIIKGRTALLMHADDIDAADELDAWRKAPDNKKNSKAGDDRSPPWTWQKYLYLDSERKHIVMPWENVSACLREAGAQLILKKQKSFKSETQAAIRPTTEFYEFTVVGKPVPLAKIEALRELKFSEQKESVKKMGFLLHQKRARVGTNKHVRVRARFDDWGVRGVLEVDSPAIDMDILRNLFELGGKVGLCDWRPGSKQSPGPFGMFELVSLKQV